MGFGLVCCNCFSKNPGILPDITGKSWGLSLTQLHWALQGPGSLRPAKWCYDGRRLWHSTTWALQWVRWTSSDCEGADEKGGKWWELLLNQDGPRENRSFSGWSALRFTKSSTKLLKLGSRLTRRPCKGDGFEILIFKANKRQNAGICRSRQKMFATPTFISTGRRVTQEWKFAFRLRVDSILLFKGQKKTLEIYDFQSSESYQGDIHSSSFFLFSTLAVPERLWQRRSHSLQQGSVVTPCPAVGPSVPFFVHVCFFCGASTEVAFFWSVSMFHPFVECQQQWFYRIYPTNDLENDKS